MIRGQIQTLMETGNELLLKARSSVSTKDTVAFTELGMKCLSEAREIADGLRRNSILLYLECVTQARKAPDYDAYLDFCARNSLDTMANKDFYEVTADILQKLKDIEG